MYEWIQHVHTYWRHGAALSAWSAGIFLINKWRFPDSESESRSVLSDSLPPHGLCSPWNSLSQNTGWYSLSLLQGIFPTQGSNPSLPHCRWILYQLSYQGSPYGCLELDIRRWEFNTSLSNAFWYSFDFWSHPDILHIQKIKVNQQGWGKTLN